MSSFTLILLKNIDQHLKKTGVKPSTFGLRVMKDKSFVSRLRAGDRSITSRTFDRVMEAIRRGNPSLAA